MKITIIFACLITVVLTAPAPVSKPDIIDAKNAQILKYDNENIGVEGYKFAFETSDGISRQEEAHLKNIGTKDEAISVYGTVTWVAADGQTYTLNYIADENGFRPEGAHLPVA